jgi:hypothetical protein
MLMCLNDVDGPSDVPGPLNLACHILPRYLHLTRHQCIALALWIIHTHVFDRFTTSPRLVLRSPVRGCGKTTTLLVVKELAAKARRADHITAAAIFRMVDFDRPTLLLDEGDNLDLVHSPTLRAVLNTGHRAGGHVVRVDGKVTRAFSTFTPVALAVIGGLPLPLSHRSVTIDMVRAPAGTELTRFDELNAEQNVDFRTVYEAIFHWARQCKLNPNPPMPQELRNRVADNWRCLLSIADACGPAWGQTSREAAIAISKSDAQQNIALADSQQAGFQDAQDSTPCAIVGVNNTTGAVFQRGFSTYSAAKTWLATDPSTQNITVSYIR